MQKLLHFDSPAGEYKADACVVSCFDARFDAALRKFLKRRGILAADHVKIAGAAKWLASPEHEDDRDFVLRQIRTSMRRHGADRLILFIHAGCGVYDGSHDARMLWGELERAAAFVRGQEPDLAIETYYLDFAGVWQAAQ
jgi:hypothetical protein